MSFSLFLLRLIHQLLQLHPWLLPLQQQLSQLCLSLLWLSALHFCAVSLLQIVERTLLQCEFRWLFQLLSCHPLLSQMLFFCYLHSLRQQFRHQQLSLCFLLFSHPQLPDLHQLFLLCLHCWLLSQWSHFLSGLQSRLLLLYYFLSLHQVSQLVLAGWFLRLR